MPVQPPAVSIIVVAFRHREALDECLRASVAAGERVIGGYELIVVDNGGLAEHVRERFPAARVLEPGFNTGFAGAVDRALAAAQGRWIALVNDDATPEPDSLAALLAAGEAAGESGTRIGSVAAQVRFSADRGRINSAGIEVDALGVATERLAGMPIAAAARAEEVFGASACYALYRRSMLDETGGFDARFFAYLEDVDLAWRARATGWRSVYEPAAVAYHQASASTGEGSPRKYYLVGRNRVWLLARNATRRQLLRALPGILLYDGAYIVYALARDRTLAPLRGRLAGLCSWHSRRRENASGRADVALARPDSLAALRMHRSYRRAGGG